MGCGQSGRSGQCGHSGQFAECMRARVILKILLRRREGCKDAKKRRGEDGYLATPKYCFPGAA